MMPLRSEHLRSSFGCLRRRMLPAALGPLLFVATSGGPAAAAATDAAGQVAEKVKTAAGDSAAEVVARVNGRPILRRDFDLSVQIQFRGRSPANVGLKELQAVREKVLDRLIENELLYQKALKTEGPAPDKDVDAEYRKIRESFPSPAGFSNALEENGVSETDFKDQIRRTLVVTHFVDRQVVGDVRITDEDAKRYYDQNPAEVVRREAVRLRQIVVRVPPDASMEDRAKARQKIEAIFKEVRAGGDFAVLARRYSEGPEASNGGDAGWLIKGKGPPSIERVAFTLAPGQTSDVIESRRGFHIIQVIEKRPEGPIPFDEAREKIRARLASRERQDKIRAYVDQLKEQARVERSLPAAS